MVVGLGAWYWFTSEEKTNLTNAPDDKINTPTTDSEYTETPVVRDIPIEDESNLQTQSIYNNGLYNVTTTYQVPNGKSHEVYLEVSLDGDTVSAAGLTFGGDEDKISTQKQSDFSDAYSDLVVGMKLDEIALSRVGGASLTTNAFNEALVVVKSQAKR